MAFAAIVDMSKTEGVFTIGTVPICYQHDFMFGSMPYGYSYVPIVQVKDGSFQFASIVEEEPQEKTLKAAEIGKISHEIEAREEEWSTIPQMRAHSSLTPSPKRRQSKHRSPNKRMASRKVYVPVSEGTRTIKKVQRAYKNELEARPNLPVSNPFATLRLIRKNSPTAVLKTMEEFPPKLQAQFRGRNPQARTPVKERLALPRTPVHERLGPKEKEKKKVATHVHERVGQFKRERVLKKMWVPKDKTRLVVEVASPKSQNKRRRLVWREKKPVVHAHVHMIGIDEECEMHAFVNVVSDEEIPLVERDDREKRDHTSSSRVELEEGPNENDQKNGDNKERWAKDEIARLESILEKNERKMAELMNEREKERGMIRRMYKFLEEKNLLEELDGRYPSSSSDEDKHKKRMFKEKKNRSKYGSSGEDEERIRKKSLKERSSKSKYESSEEEEEISRKRPSKSKKNKTKYESSEEEEERRHRRHSKDRRYRNRYESGEDEISGARPRTGARRPEPMKQIIQEMINLQLQAVGAGRLVNIRKRCGRPYPREYEQIPYPLGYQVPKFNLFDGTGRESITPDQHLVQFRNACGNTAHDEALLLKQFSQSLTGAAFEWYSSLENDSVEAWDEMEDLFRAKFAMVTQRITMADVACEKPRPHESPLDYINRWRNMNIRCTHQMPEREAVEFLIRNLDDWIRLATEMNSETEHKVLSKRREPMKPRLVKVTDKGTIATMVTMAIKGIITN